MDHNVSQLTIQPLSFQDQPESALFYVLDEPSHWKHGEPADGMAFLVSTTGILATAAHVVWLGGKFPGNTIRVFCPSPVIPIRATAQILRQGWRGPQPDSTGQMPRLPGRSDLLDERPDVLKEDIALLQLIPDTIEIDDSRGGNPDSLQVLISRLRMMPLGVPGYRAMENAVFTMWSVDRHFTAPRMVAVNGTFRTHERALHSAFQIAAPEVTHGHSGGPVWDNERRLAVGFIRSGTSKRLKGAARCTDARAIHEYAALPLTWDTDLAHVVGVAKGLATDSLSDRYAPFSTSAEIFIEPRARPLRQQFDMGLTNDSSNGTPAINFVRETVSESAMVCLLGGPGAGKSTLLRTFALEMLANTAFLGQGPCIPLIVNARDIPSNFDLDTLFGLSHRWDATPDVGEHVLSDVLARNDVRVALLIDGLDEVEDRQGAQLLAQCQGLLLGNTSVFRVLLTSRPNDRLFKQSSNHPSLLRLIEVLAFDATQIQAYVGQCMPDTVEGGKFQEALRRVEWHRNALPLQLKMASVLFRVENSLPSRELDLPFEYVRLLINRSFDQQTVLKGSSDVPESWTEIYRPNVAKVLQALALVTLEFGQQTFDQLPTSLSGLSIREPFDKVLQRPNECVDYIRAELIPRIGLVTVQRRVDGDRLAWEHSTFIDILAAEGRLSIAGTDPEAVANLVDWKGTFGRDRFMLTQLSAMDRAGWQNQVAHRVKRAMEAPFSDRKEGMLALRALAMGIELPKDLKQRLVILLIRIALSPKHDFMFCSEVFTDGEGLPSARDILQRDNMRNDVISALWMRFHLRDPRRHGKRGPLIVSQAEATLLDLLHLWNEWLDRGLELAHPNSLSKTTRSAGHARGPLGQSFSGDSGKSNMIVVDRGGFEIRHRDSTVSTFEIPARTFLEGVAAMAQKLPTNLPASQVVALYLKAAVEGLEGE